MLSNVEPSKCIKPRKRSLEDTLSESQPATKHRRLQPQSPLPYPSLSASPIHNSHSRRPQPREQPGRKETPRSEPKPPRRAFEDTNSDRPLTSKHPPQSSSKLPRSDFLHGWLQSTCDSRLVEAKARAGQMIPTKEITTSSEVPMPDSQAPGDQASQHDEETSATPSMESGQSERLDASSPMYRATLKMNGVLIDKFGTEIPQDIHDLVDKHIRKERKSPRLGKAERTKIVQVMGQIWDMPEPSVSKILNTDLFPLDDPGIAWGGKTLWSFKPMPRNPVYPYAIPAPKTDRHFGFPLSLHSDWTAQELIAADHLTIRPRSQPTDENLFPSFLVEVQSEATNGTTYAGENRVAGAGAHRVRSMIDLLDLVDASRIRTSADAFVFSTVVTQRGTVAYVHYYHVEKQMYYMSYITDFSFLMNPQECHDHHKNVAEWLLNIQRPAVREVLTKLYPITKLWKWDRSDGATTEVAKTDAIEEERPSKRQRT